MSDITFPGVVPVTRDCTGCGEPFTPKRTNQKRCKPNCSAHKSRSKESKDGARKKRVDEHEVEFIAVDGEGGDSIGVVEEWSDDEGGMVFRRIVGHDYYVLSVGDQTLHKNGERLTHHDIFAFLWEQYLAHPKAVFVGFFLGYDFSQWFRSLTARQGFKLLHKDGIASRMPKPDSEMIFPWPVRVGEWEIDILGQKRFKLRPFVPKDQRVTRVVNHKDGTASVVEEPRPWMYVCDAGAFFQTSLLNAIDPKKWPGNPICTEEEYRVLKEGKESREGGKAAVTPEVIRYNLLENDVLARLMKEVNRGFVADGIKLNRTQWFGPGQAAQKWLGLVGCPTGEEIRDAVPEWARDAAKESYYGGWFEIFYHGLVPGTTYGYDINSAYPYAIASLPCLLHGTWTCGDGRPPKYREGDYRLVEAEVSGNDPVVGAMLHRTARKTILRPQKTGGWYWHHELEAAKRAGVVNRVKVSRWVNYRPCSCPPPLRAIAELYEGRLLVGAPPGTKVEDRTKAELSASKESAYGKSKKLVYNSSYGKLAQSIGNPKFSNAIYASLITARCRTMILDAIATHPNGTRDLVMVATDSVTFLTPHPTIDQDPNRLGAWGEEPHENLSLFMPGVYWDDASRESIRERKSLKVKSRGVSARDLATMVERIDGMWEEYRNAIMTMAEFRPPLPEARINITFSVISGKVATTRDAWETCGMVVKDGEKVLSAEPGAKRVGPTASERHPGLLDSSPYPFVPGEPRTTPYSAGFGEELRDVVSLSYQTPDGPVDMMVKEGLNL